MTQLTFVLPPFIIELIKSFFSPKPWFAKALQVSAAIALFVSGVPAAITALHIDLPASIVALESTAINVAAIVTAIVAQLTTNVNAVVQKAIDLTKKGLQEEAIHKSFMVLLLISTLFLGSCNHKPVSVLPAPIPQLSLQFDNWALGSDSINMVPNYQGINLWYSCNNDGGLSFYCIGFIQNGTTETGGPQPFTNGISTDTVKLLVLDSTLYFKKNSYNFTYIYSAKKH